MLHLQVTLAMAVFRKLSWFKAFTYILGQIIGAWLGALVVFANYSRAIDIFEGGNGQKTLKTAGLFSTYPVRTLFFNACLFSQSVLEQLAYVSSANCFFDEVSPAH
jgi:aquaglyceroporin related protein